MIRQEIQFPTLSTFSNDLEPLRRLWSQCLKQAVYVFNFTECGFITPEGTAFLGGLARLIEHRGGRVIFRWETVKEKVANLLAQNGFMKCFGSERRPWPGNSIPYLENLSNADKAFASYLSTQWLKPGRIKIDDDGIQAINSAMCEAYVNAFEHSNTPIGVCCCGQYYPVKRELSLCLVDFGVGIPSVVRRFHRNKIAWANATDVECLEWAFKRGNSTRPKPTGGVSGLGLHVLSEFTRANPGKLHVASYGAQATVTKGKARFTNDTAVFSGTMISLRILCDNTSYQFEPRTTSFNSFLT